MHIILPTALVFKLKLLLESIWILQTVFLAVYIPLPWHFVLSKSIVWKCLKLLYKVSIKIEKKKRRTDICEAILENLSIITSHTFFLVVSVASLYV